MAQITTAVIYRQAYEQPYEEVFIDVDAGEYQKVDCADCGGVGTFHITDRDSQVCNECKGAGFQWFNVY